MVNVALDLLFVAGFQWGVGGAAFATVVAQGLSVVLCLIRMSREKDESLRLDMKKLKLNKDIMAQVIRQGLPTGIQNSVVSVGNLVIETNINAFGAFAMSGVGAHSKIKEGIVFLPIIEHVHGPAHLREPEHRRRGYERAKKGAAVGTISSMILAELVGILYFYVGSLCDEDLCKRLRRPIEFGVIHCRTRRCFLFLLAFSHCAAGVMRGCGKSFMPMAAMLAFWCGVRILYVSIAIQIVPVFQTISWAYPLTWFLSSVAFFVSLVRMDWKKL